MQLSVMTEVPCDKPMFPDTNVVKSTCYTQHWEITNKSRTFNSKDSAEQFLKFMQDQVRLNDNGFYYDNPRPDSVRMLVGFLTDETN